jgi:hypothetical protein
LAGFPLCFLFGVKSIDGEIVLVLSDVLQVRQATDSAVMAKKSIASMLQVLRILKVFLRY